MDWKSQDTRRTEALEEIANQLKEVKAILMGIKRSFEVSVGLLDLEREKRIQELERQAEVLRNECVEDEGEHQEVYDKLQEIEKELAELYSKRINW